MSQQGLKQTQTLQQKMSPQQIQMIKLIEVTGLELKDKIEQEIQENPALEEGEEQDEMSNEEMEDNSDDKELIRDDVDFEEDAVCPSCGKELFPELPDDAEEDDEDDSDDGDDEDDSGDDDKD